MHDLTPDDFDPLEYPGGTSVTVPEKLFLQFGQFLTKSNVTFDPDRDATESGTVRFSIKKVGVAEVRIFLREFIESLNSSSVERVCPECDSSNTEDGGAEQATGSGSVPEFSKTQIHCLDCDHRWHSPK